ncbi:hypothetical protein FOZ62_014626 [Perkinsus olseni]|uniref:Uncharacterized protein n=2 Tax=Perkinsus olseni TaxID=32597 RepID=A0A7J6TPD7_PEROL|nr:hypothetical protein FOZ62_014626 [Perkinsus olseni]
MVKYDSRTRRAIFQVTLTLTTFATAIGSFVALILFQAFLTDLSDNFKGELTSKYLPCVRHTLSECDNTIIDKCWDRCCPTGYVCEISPVVGLLCKDGVSRCGGCPGIASILGHNNNNNFPSSGITTVEPVMLTTETTAAMKTEEECQVAFTWCRDFADVSGQCRTKVCIDHKLIENMTLAAFVLAGLALILDIIDMVIFVATPDSVILKSFLNLSSSCIKWVAFGVVLGSGADQFMSDLQSAECFNDDGAALVSSTSSVLTSFLVIMSLSAILSMVMAPTSAYYGGKLVGAPYVSTR